MEALIFIADPYQHPNPVEQRRRSYLAGMVVHIQEDGSPWGREESKQVWITEGRPAADWPKQGVWAILKVPGVPAARALALVNEQIVDDVGTPVVDAVNGNPLAYRKRDWVVRVGLVPQAIRDAILANGEVTVTVAQIRNFIKRVRDDAQFTGLD